MTAWVPQWTALPDSAEDTLRHLVQWLRSPPLWRLVREWGPATGPDGDPGALLAWLDAFSAEHWDYRRGRERNLAASAGLTPAQEGAALALCPELGLAPSEPRARRYDAVVMTGGMVRAGLVKPRFVRTRLDGGLETRRVVFLGAHREFAGDEQRLGAALGVPGSDEVDAMVAGMRAAFGLGSPQLRSAGEGYARSTEVTWPQVPSPRFEVLAAPSSRAGLRRADTADTLRHWADGAGDSVRSVLLVTTPIYVPYQAAVAVETLGIERGMAIETVGADAAATDLGAYTQLFTAQHHLQELRSAIRGMRSLYERLSEPRRSILR